MVVGQAKFGMNLLMAIQTGPRITLWIVDECRGSHPTLDMEARRAVTRFAASSAMRCLGGYQAGMRTGRKNIGDALMTIGADLITHMAGTLYLRRPDHRLLHRGATACPKGNKQQAEHATAHGLEKFIHASFFMGHGPSLCHGFSHIGTHSPVQALATHQPAPDDYMKSDTRKPRPS